MIDEELNKAAEEYAKLDEEGKWKDGGKYKGFIAGAKWQAKQFEKNRLAACDAQTKEEYDREVDFATRIIEQEHRQPTFNDAINYGMKLQKKQMMEEAVEGYITFNLNAHEEGLPDITAIADEKPLEFYEKRGFKLGDKVRIIVIPNTDEK